MPVTVRRILPAVIAALVFFGMAVLYVTGRRDISDEILRTWGVDPFRFPFLDTETVLSAVRCYKAGVDVFVTNPCDPLRRVLDYSPLWLLLAKFPVTEAWLTPAGLIVDIGFIASLTLLPPGRSGKATALIVVGVLSSAVVFALERGNNDLVLFALAAIAASLACRTPALRWIGYGAALLAGLLKYYPMTLMAMVTRERPRRFFAVVVASLAVVGLFLLTMGHDLVRVLQEIPKGGWFGDMFGSTTLSGGLAREYGWSSGAEMTLRVLLALIALAAGAALAMRSSTKAAVERLSDREQMALLAGALLIVSCFFTAQNIGYRATHFLLTLPALTALTQLRAGRLWPVTLAAVLALLWAQGWRNWIGEVIAGRSAMVSLWIVREALWWWTITMMLALVFGLLARSEMGRRVFRPRSAG